MFVKAQKKCNITYLFLTNNVFQFCIEIFQEEKVSSLKYFVQLYSKPLSRQMVNLLEKEIIYYFKTIQNKHIVLIKEFKMIYSNTLNYIFYVIDSSIVTIVFTKNIPHKHIVLIIPIKILRQMY